MLLKVCSQNVSKGTKLGSKTIKMDPKGTKMDPETPSSSQGIMIDQKVSK